MMVIMAVMAIFLTVAVETATFQQRREKEEELIFRGNQVVEAIRLFRGRNGRYPIALDELTKANPRILRKVWKDPITGHTDWVPVLLGEDGTALTPPAGATPTPAPTPATQVPGGGAARGGPIIGVKSRSCNDSIKIYNGHTRYCDWKFFFDANRPLGGASPSQVTAPTP
jgi:type II secretory pathway pseudopilin PulG